MSRGAIGIAILAMVMALCLSQPALAQSQTTVTGAGAGLFPAGAAAFRGVSLSGLRFGMGVSIAANGTATGDFQSTLLGTSAAGQPQTITVVGKPSSGSLSGASTATFSGLCAVDMGNGTTLTGVPFTATAVAGVGSTESLTLTLSSTNLPTATGTDGRITVAK
jgi:hypothetical protein